MSKVEKIAVTSKLERIFDRIEERAANVLHSLNFTCNRIMWVVEPTSSKEVSPTVWINFVTRKKAHKRIDQAVNALKKERAKLDGIIADLEKAKEEL